MVYKILYVSTILGANTQNFLTISIVLFVFSGLDSPTPSGTITLLGWKVRVLNNEGYLKKKYIFSVYIQL